MQGRALAVDCRAWRDRSTQVNQVQLNKHALSKRKFPVQSASFLFTVSVHSPDDPKGWESICVCVRVTVSSKEHSWLVSLMHITVISGSYMTVKSWYNQKVKLFKVVKAFNASLVIFYVNILIYLAINYYCPREFLALWKDLGFAMSYLKTLSIYTNIRFSFHANLDPAKGLHASVSHSN